MRTPRVVPNPDDGDLWAVELRLAREECARAHEVTSIRLETARDACLYLLAPLLTSARIAFLENPTHDREIAMKALNRQREAIVAMVRFV